MLTSRSIIIEINGTTCCIVEDTILNQDIVHMGVGLIVVRNSPVGPAGKLAILESVGTRIATKSTDRIVANTRSINGNTIKSNGCIQL